MRALIEPDDGFDSRVVINPDNSVIIVGLTLWVAFPGHSVEISPDGQIVEDGGYVYVRVKRERRENCFLKAGSQKADTQK